MRSKKSLCDERAHLINEKFLGTLTAIGAQRILEIEAEIDRLDAPRLAKVKEQDAADLAAMDRQLADLEAKINKAKNASSRPQTKTAGSY